jgi:hypothetical protein
MPTYDESWRNPESGDRGFKRRHPAFQASTWTGLDIRSAGSRPLSSFFNHLHPRLRSASSSHHVVDRRPSETARPGLPPPCHPLLRVTFEGFRVTSPCPIKPHPGGGYHSGSADETNTYLLNGAELRLRDGIIKSSSNARI